MVYVRHDLVPSVSATVGKPCRHSGVGFVLLRWRGAHQPTVTENACEKQQKSLKEDQ